MILSPTRVLKYALPSLQGCMPCSFVIIVVTSTNMQSSYVYMGAIISSDPFWLMVSKGLLLYDLSGFMPCLILLCSVPVACCYLALNIAS